MVSSLLKTVLQAKKYIVKKRMNKMLVFTLSKRGTESPKGRNPSVIEKTTLFIKHYKGTLPSLKYTVKYKMASMI